MVLGYMRLLWTIVVGMVRLMLRITVHLWWSCMRRVRRLRIVALTVVVLWWTVTVAISLTISLVVTMATATAAWIHFRFFTRVGIFCASASFSFPANRAGR
jgi:hypothetical protein